jgi:2-polyprenyl-3-methyl-5-hydroxy-6-metoxy-1,4-benzoquinol methylase
MTTFNQAQYDDLVSRSEDVYAHTKYDILERYLADRPFMRILNVGCGSGDLSIRLAQLGHHVCGIDVEPAYIRLAQDNVERTSTRGPCSFAVCSIEDYQSEARFDCLVSTDVLEHIADDRRALAKMVDLLSPGGLLLITVPAGPWLFGYHDEQLGHYRRYTKRTLRQLAEEFCSIERIRYFGFTLVPVCYLYSRHWRKAYPVTDLGNAAKSSVKSVILRWLLKLDRLTPFLFGTSLIMKATRREMKEEIGPLRVADYGQVKHRSNALTKP